MDCFKIRIPDGTCVHGFTAGGQDAPVYPGEYLVHRLAKAGPDAPALLRFVGADALGRDVHVPVAAVADLQPLLARGGPNAASG